MIMSVIMCFIYALVTVLGLALSFFTETREITHTYEARGQTDRSKQRKFEFTIERESVYFFFTDEMFLRYEEPLIYAVQSNGEKVNVSKLRNFDRHSAETDAVSFYVSEKTYTYEWRWGYVILGAYVLLVVIYGEFRMIRRAKRIICAEREKTSDFVRSFYQKCYSLKITDITADGALEKAMLVGQSFQLTTAEEVKKAFVLGQKEELKADEAHKAQILQKKQQEEKEKMAALRQLRQKVKLDYDNEKRLSSITGKQKYLSIIDTQCKALDRDCESLANFNALDAFQHHKADNWGWAGGLASGIAGPGAGVVAAMESHEKTKQHNAAVDKFNADLIASGYDPLKLNEKRDKKIASWKKKKEKLQNYSALINNAVIDNNAQQYFDDLKFTITGSYLRDSGYLQLSVTVLQEEAVTILDAPACLDGSVRISVLDSQNKVVGEAYFNAAYECQPSKAGFDKTKTRKVIAIPLAGDCFDCEELYHFSVAPVSMWLIERVV